MLLVHGEVVKRTPGGCWTTQRGAPMSHRVPRPRLPRSSSTRGGRRPAVRGREDRHWTFGVLQPADTGGFIQDSGPALLLWFDNSRKDIEACRRDPACTWTAGLVLTLLGKTLAPPPSPKALPGRLASRSRKPGHGHPQPARARLHRGIAAFTGRPTRWSTARARWLREGMSRLPRVSATARRNF